jgi:hypothetical protein
MKNDRTKDQITAFKEKLGERDAKSRRSAR